MYGGADARAGTCKYGDVAVSGLSGNRPSAEAAD